MKLKDLIVESKQPSEYIDTPDGQVKLCKSGPLLKTNFIVGPYTNDKASDKIPDWDKIKYYKEYITRLLPESMIKKVP